MLEAAVQQLLEGMYSHPFSKMPLVLSKDEVDCPHQLEDSQAIIKVIWKKYGIQWVIPHVLYTTDHSCWMDWPVS